MESVKLYLTALTVERLREEALRIGKSEEWFTKWVDDCVIIVEPYIPTKRGRLRNLFRR